MSLACCGCVNPIDVGENALIALPRCWTQEVKWHHKQEVAMRKSLFSIVLVCVSCLLAQDLKPVLCLGGYGQTPSAKFHVHIQARCAAEDRRLMAEEH